MPETRLKQARLLQRRGVREVARAANRGDLDHSEVSRAERGQNHSLRVLSAMARSLDLKDLQEAIATIHYWTEPLDG